MARDLMGEDGFSRKEAQEGRKKEDGRCGGGKWVLDSKSSFCGFCASLRLRIFKCESVLGIRAQKKRMPFGTRLFPWLRNRK